MSITLPNPVYYLRVALPLLSTRIFITWKRPFYYGLLETSSTINLLGPALSCCSYLGKFSSKIISTYFESLFYWKKIDPELKYCLLYLF